MRILVFPNELGIGGSQLNAIELGAAVRDLGHEVVVFGEPGVLVERIGSLGLEFLAAPKGRIRPSPTLVRALHSIVQERGIDVVHGYEWPPAVTALLATRGTRAVPAATVMSMAVAPFIPRGLPLVVGTEEIAARERTAGRSHVDVIEPPVDLRDNDLGQSHDHAGFRRWAGAEPDSLLVVVVGRLSHELKLEGLLTAAAVVPFLSRSAQLVLVGDGEARSQLEEAAVRANATARRQAVLVPGSLQDPRPAYAAADIVLGMGGSALRAMAFRKPVVVQGERGFWLRLSPETLETFLWQGWFGLGEGAWTGASRLEAELAPLIGSPSLRATLGDFALETVRERFSLEAAALAQVSCYERARTAKGRRGRAEALRATSIFGLHALRRKSARRRGDGPRDDFNAVAGAKLTPHHALSAPPMSHHSPRGGTNHDR